MGMFDYVYVNDSRFVCSEGHALSGEEFQTKDFDCVLGGIHIDDGRVSFSEGCLEVTPGQSPLNGTFETYCTCRMCPAFVQYGTGNLCPVSCDFEVEVAGNVVFAVRRIGETTAQFLESTPRREHMKDCEGPMPYETAYKRHVEYPANIRDAWKEKMRRQWAEKTKL